MWIKPWAVTTDCLSKLSGHHKTGSRQLKYPIFSWCLLLVHTCVYALTFIRTHTQTTTETNKHKHTNRVRAHVPSYTNSNHSGCLIRSGCQEDCPTDHQELYSIIRSHHQAAMSNRQITIVPQAMAWWMNTSPSVNLGPTLLPRSTCKVG